MIYSFLHQGSGVGNQLARYVAVRVKALELGVDWGMLWNPDSSGKPLGFKCKDFIKFDDSKIKLIGEVMPQFQWNEKKVTENGVDIRSYDPEFNFIEDNTIIEGEFQDERYWEHREKEVNEWLKVEPLEVPDDTCVIGFRGGEFSLYPDLFLTKEYWEEAMNLMVEKHGIKRFEVHTDDERLAREFFGDIPVIHAIGINWRSMRYAKHAIIANSSFFILPRWLKQGGLHFGEVQTDEKGLKFMESSKPITIAPRYWGRRNTKVWSLPQNYYKRFKYI